MNSIWIRVAFYIVLTLGIVQMLMLETSYFDGNRRFSEFGLVQMVQSLFLFASSIIVWIASRLNYRYRELAVCFTLSFVALLIRENDQIFEIWLIHGFWKWPALVVLLCLAWYFIRHRRAVVSQLKDLSLTLSFGILLAAFSTLLFSRLFGGSKFWKALMASDYNIMAKIAAEESTELFALGLFLAFALEFLLAGSKDSRA